jgi:hypothetical protein
MILSIIYNDKSNSSLFRMKLDVRNLAVYYYMVHQLSPMQYMNNIAELELAANPNIEFRCLDV